MFAEKLHQAARIPLAAPLFALALGLAVIGGRSFATDEAFSWGLITQPDLSSTWDGIEFTSGNMLVYLAVLKLFSFGGDGEVWLRLPSLLAMVTAVAMLYRVGRRWFDPRTGTIAAFLAASSVPLLYYAIETRSYAFVALTSIATWAQLEKALRTDSSRSWWLLGLFAGLMVSSHIINALVLPVMAALVLILLDSQRLMGRLLRLAPIGLFVMPSVLLIMLGDGSQTDWIPSLGPSTIGRGVRFLAGDHAQFTHDFTGFVLVAAYLIVYLSAMVGFVRRSGWQKRSELLAWAWFLGLPVMITAVSVVDPLLWHRYLIGALPGALLVAAHRLSMIEPRRLVVAVVVLIVALGTIRTFALRNHSADEYEALAVFIEQNAEPGDSLAVVRPWTRVGLDYYFRDGAPIVGEPPFTTTFDHRADPMGLTWIEPGNRLWLVDRADAGQVWVEMKREDDDFGFESVDGDLAGRFALVAEYDVQRFRVRLYEPEP